MKKNILIGLLMLLNGAFAQDKNGQSIEKLQTEVTTLKTNVQHLQQDNSNLKTNVSNANNEIQKLQLKIDTLNQKIANNTVALNSAENKLGLKIANTQQATNKRIDDVDNSLSKTSLFVIIGILTAIIISIIVYWLLNKKQKTDKSDIIERLNNTKNSIEENLVKEFSKQTELMETQIKLIENKTQPEAQNISVQEIDHSLALKVADEITLIERNISLMDNNVKGLKQLARSVQKLKDNLNANGYEMPELLNKQFHQGMKLIVVNSIPDENLNKGDEVITKIIKPQVNYRDKMIQAAQVEVSVG